MRLLSRRWTSTGCMLFVLLVCLALLTNTSADDPSRARPTTAADDSLPRDSVEPSSDDAETLTNAPDSNTQHTPAASPHIKRSSATPSSEPDPLSAFQVDSQLLHELDRLIELHQQKVDVLLRMRRTIRQTTLTATAADHSSPTASTFDSAFSATDPSFSASPITGQGRHHRQRPSSSSEPFTLSSAIPQLVQRAALFLAAIAVLVVYQYVQHRRARQPSTTHNAADWQHERLARRRRHELLDQQQRSATHKRQHDVTGVRRRRSAVGEGEVEEVEGKEWRVESEVYEERESGEWDEAEGDFFDASASRHDGYVGVFGIEDDEKEGDGDEEHDGEAARDGGGMVADDDEDDDEYEQEAPDDDQG